MKKIILVPFVFLLFIPTLVNAGWFGDLFSKKPTTTIQQDSKQTNNNTNTVQNSQKVDNQFVGGAVNIPENQKSFILNFKDLNDLFSPALNQSNSLSEKQLNIISEIGKKADINSNTLNLTLKNIESLKNLENLKEINETLKKPTEINYTSDTKTFLDAIKQAFINPLQKVGDNLNGLVSTLLTNNQALTNAINNMSFSPSSGGSSIDTVQNLDATGNVTAWASVVVIGTIPLTANETITIPTAVGNIGKTIKFIRVDSTAFTVTLVGQAGETITTLNAGVELNTSNGALTLEAITATTIRQQSNIGTSSSATVDYVSVAGSVNSAVLTVNSAVLFNITNSGNIPYNSATGLFTLTAGKTYRLNAGARVVGASQADLTWMTSANVQLAASHLGGNANIAADFQSVETIYTPTVNTDVKLAATGVGTSPQLSANQHWANIVQISGFTPTSGTSVDNAFGTKSSNQTGIAVATDISWASSGSIPFAANSWTLTAGKTYWLEAMLAAGNTSGNSASYAWVDSSNNIIVGTTQGNTKSPTGAVDGSAQSNAAGYFTPSVNTTVKVRVTFVSGTMSIAGGTATDSTQGSSWADIRQIGTTAISGGVQGPITLTTTGTSGAATLVSDVLNIPNYSPTAPTVQTFNSSGTYTRPVGLKYAIVKMSGGGGGSGGVPVAGASAYSLGGAGGGGGYVEAMLTAAQLGATQTVTIGIGGTAGVSGGANGGTGGSTSLGATLLLVGGGIGGGFDGSNVSARALLGGGGGGFSVMTGTNIGSKNGEQGSPSFGTTTANAATTTGKGGSGGFGNGTNGNTSTGGGGPVNSVAGAANTGNGASGNAQYSGSGPTAGQSGGSGKIVVVEFY